MDAEKTFTETAEEVEKEQPVTEAQEPSPEKEVTQKDELADDKEYQEVKKGIDDDINNQKTIHPRFREVYKQYKDSERKGAELQKQLDDLAQKEPEPYSPSDDELANLASTRGFKLDKVQQAQEKIDAFQAMMDKVANPQDRDWLNNYGNALMTKFSEAQGERTKKVDEALNYFTNVALDYRHGQSEDKARKLITDINKKHSLNINYDTDVDPVINKQIQELKTQKKLDMYDTDVIHRLAHDWLAKNGIGFGKRLSEKEQRELNEKKKQANIEGEGTTAAPKVNFDKMTFQEIARHTEKELA